jgi:hypothetical protein
VSIPTPTAEATSVVQVTPSTISRTITIGVATLAHGSTTTPNTVVLSVSIPAPSVTSGTAAAASPTTVTASTSFPGVEAVAGHDEFVAAATIQLTAVVGLPLVGIVTTGEVYPLTIFGSVSISTPSISGHLRIVEMNLGGLAFDQPLLGGTVNQPEYGGVVV